MPLSEIREWLEFLIIIIILALVYMRTSLSKAQTNSDNIQTNLDETPANSDRTRGVGLGDRGSNEPP